MTTFVILSILGGVMSLTATVLVIQHGCYVQLGELGLGLIQLTCPF